MLEKIKAYIRQHHMIRPGEKVLLGVSGGADSVAMLLVMNELKEELGIKLLVLHVNHNIRGDSADRDQEFTKKLCESLGINCICSWVDVPTLAEESGRSLEEEARVQRYSELYETYKEQCCQHIAVAHNADDNGETMLFNMVRGSGLKGASGIPPVRGEIIRPLLCVSRQEILEYLESKKQPYCTDETNADQTYTRNKIRHSVMPLLKEINPEAVSHLNRLTRQISQAEDYLRTVAGQYEETCLEGQQGQVELDLKELSKADPVIQTYILQDALQLACGRQKDLTEAHVEALADLAEGDTGRCISLPYGIYARKDYGSLILTDMPQEIEEDSIDTIDIDLEALGQETTGCYENAAMSLTMKWAEYPGQEELMKANPCTKYVDCDKIKCNLSIRHPNSGDYFVLDAQGRRKSMNRFMIDQKISRQDRKKIWVLADDHHVLWIIGQRLSYGARVSAETQRILQINIQMKTEEN